MPSDVSDVQGKRSTLVSKVIIKSYRLINFRFSFLGDSQSEDWIRTSNCCILLVQSLVCTHNFILFGIIKIDIDGSCSAFCVTICLTNDVKAVV